MQGVSFSNIFGIASRGFVSLYGVVAAIIIERSYSDVISYAIILSFTLFLAAYFSYLISKKRLSLDFSGSFKFNLSLFFNKNKELLIDNDFESSVKVRGISSVLLGLQFVAIVIAYVFCFVMPDRRLFIISLVPLISMLGTMFTVIIVEPKFAVMIDAANSTGYAASREFLRARAISFGFSAVFIAILPFAINFLEK